jgi:hypothetical protein
LKIEAITIAWSGVAARVATSVATAFDASCSPFVIAKATANAIAIASPGSIERLYAERAGRASSHLRGNPAEDKRLYGIDAG